MAAAENYNSEQEHVVMVPVPADGKEGDRYISAGNSTSISILIEYGPVPLFRPKQ